MSELMPGVAHDLKVNGINLHYFTWGEFTTPEKAVVLVHGLTANSQSWAEFGPYLALQGCYAIAPDLRGRGLSEKPPHGYGVPFHTNDILSLCDALNLPRFNLVGHSLGALISMFLTVLHPGRVRKLALVDAGGIVPQDTAQAIAMSLSRLGQVYPSLDAYLNFFRQAPIFQWNDLWENYFRYDAEVHPDGTVTSRVSKDAINEEIMSNATIRTEVLPDYLKVPTLIVRATVGMLGPDKGLVLPREEAERMQGIIPDSRILEIPDTNHYTVCLPDLFKREVTAFLAG